MEIDGDMPYEMTGDATQFLSTRHKLELPGKRDPQIEMLLALSGPVGVSSGHIFD